MTRSIIGFFPDHVTATRALTELSAAGFDTAHLAIALPDAPVRTDDAADRDQADPATEAAVGGSVIGGTAGALLAATGALVIPGVGPVIAGGFLASLVGGAAGWLVGGLMGHGLSPEEAAAVAERVRVSRLLVVVQAQGRDAEARQILLRAGAEDIEERGPGGATTTLFTRIADDATRTHPPGETPRDTGEGPA